jgi:uncharacterized protein YlxW (UPF0749 family)
MIIIFDSKEEKFHSCIINLGIAETYKNQPSNPVDFLAKWLLNHNLASVTESQMKDLAKEAASRRDLFEKEKKDLLSQQEKSKKEQEQKESKIEDFYKKFHQSDDLEDHLQELVEFLAVSTHKLIKIL